MYVFCCGVDFVLVHGGLSGFSCQRGSKNNKEFVFVNNVSDDTICLDSD